MFKRKLTALEYHHPDTFNVDSEEECRNLVVWLEDQKIRFYKIEDREALRDVKNDNWTKSLTKYLLDLQCPLLSKQKTSVMDWLLSHAIRLEYSENAQKFNSLVKEEKESSQSEENTGFTQDLLNITTDDPDLKAGIISLSRLLNLPEHHDHFVLLQAIRSLIDAKLSQEAIQESGKKKKEKESVSKKSSDIISLHRTDLGFDTGDPAVNEAAKILRLLHVAELRDLQTKINEAIVRVQAVTANPKTDQKLGRVGK
ncbi:RNA transcription, translation and transport factor protein-like [Actinia tenebrosa]|uniref:RNA transcription, translation and transport factor protein-like n=1 Tax=Actinia tenebrosa TaxID=6105 RepID=A0A6P8HPP6_ACTTE|nr:RNA transcription, translation and transport factor protein-like [Actinia tenebrosa]